MPKLNKPARAAESEAKDTKPAIAHPKPKILMLDLDDDACDGLTRKGFNVRKGSFGKPYTVAKGGGFQPVIGKANLPNYTEQEIVVVDLLAPKRDSGPQGEKHRPDSESDLWAKCDRGYIDPRVRAMWHVRDSFDRILSGGGAFVVFADAKQNQELQFAKVSRGQFRELYDVESFIADIWDFLSACRNLVVKEDHGEEMVSCDADHDLGKLVAKHLSGGNFACTIYGGTWNGLKWINLCENKFGEVVGVAWLGGEEGTIIVVPQIEDKAGFLESLFTEILPELAPHLFPGIVRGKWVHQSEYELPRVLELQKAREEVERRTKNELDGLEQQIEQERTAHGWLHELITGTDAELVESVKQALCELGFQKVVDVDEEMDKEGVARREDLQIHDTSPTLIVDIKGLGGHPADADAFQSHKHATLRLQEWKRFDVQALTVINHQRHMPPLSRDNGMPFRQEILDFAGEVKMGLLTAWDLFRFVRSALKWNWDPKHTMPVLYDLGRIDPIPKHYEYLGRVAHVWSGAVSIQIEAAGLQMHDRIAFELDVEFEEQDVTSLQLNKAAVQTGEIGSCVGTESQLMRPKVKDGMRVFLVRQ